MKKEKNESIPNKNSLEWHEQYYVVYCEWCEERLIVHGFRREMKGKEKIIYAHCVNGLCPKKGEEIANSGNPQKPEKLSYDRKIKKIKDCMRTPRTPIVRVQFIRGQVRRISLGARA